MQRQRSWDILDATAENSADGPGVNCQLGLLGREGGGGGGGGGGLCLCSVCLCPVCLCPVCLCPVYCVCLNVFCVYRGVCVSRSCVCLCVQDVFIWEQWCLCVQGFGYKAVCVGGMCTHM